MPIKTQNPYDFNDDWISKIWRKLGVRGIPKHVINQIESKDLFNFNHF